MAKAQRTSRELQEAIMHEVRRHPEWNDILSVTKGHRGEPKIRRSWRFPRGLLRSKHFGRRLARTGALLSGKRHCTSSRYCFRSAVADMLELPDDLPLMPTVIAAVSIPACLNDRASLAHLKASGMCCGSQL